jgi:hypothetical protein
MKCLSTLSAIHTGLPVVACTCVSVRGEAGHRAQACCTWQNELSHTRSSHVYTDMWCVSYRPRISPASQRIMAASHCEGGGNGGGGGGIVGSGFLDRLDNDLRRRSAKTKV